MNTDEHGWNSEKQILRLAPMKSGLAQDDN